MNYLRVIFGLIVVGIGALTVVYEPDWVTYAVVGGGAAVVVMTLLLEGRIRQGDPRQVMAGGIGLLVGLMVAWLVVALASSLPFVGEVQGGAFLPVFAMVLFFAVLAYIGATTGRSLTYDLTLFRQPEKEELAKARFLVGEKSLIDGRIVKLAESPLLTGEIIVPRFVVDQLNQLAASHVAIERFRGERGLDSLRRLQQNRLRPVYIREIDLLHGEIEGVLDYAVAHDARIVTHNPEMIREANRRAIPIVNLNEVSEMLEPEVLSGDELVVRLVKQGKEQDQGVGYLDNGNMVVVEDAREDIGRTVRVQVTGIHQTRAGTLIFAKKGGNEDGDGSEAGETVESTEGAGSS